MVQDLSNNTQHLGLRRAGGRTMHILAAMTEAYRSHLPHILFLIFMILLPGELVLNGDFDCSVREGVT